MLGIELHAPRRLFCSPKGPRSRWSSIWKTLVAFCPWVHRTVQCTPDSEQCNNKESLDWLLSASGGTRPSGAPCDRWSEALHVDSPVNYSRRRLKFSRASSTTTMHRTVHRTVRWVAPDRPVQCNLAHFLLFQSYSLLLLLA
jgi:hypothetical protein